MPTAILCADGRTSGSAAAGRPATGSPPQGRAAPDVHAYELGDRAAVAVLTRAYKICLVQVQRRLVVLVLEEPVVEFEYLRLFSVVGC